MRRFLFLLVAAATFAVPAADASAGQPAVVEYSPPVDRPVVDGFRRPQSEYGPGNRGVDYATEPGEEVRSPAAGEVTFAGQVGGTLHVVVLHADGLRSTLSFLATVAVRRGERVAAGQVVGTAAGALHFGVRAGEEYLDPLGLLAGEEPEVRLAPLEAEDISEAAERSSLQKLLGVLGRSGIAAGRAGMAWARRAATPPLVSSADTVRAWTSVARTLAVPEVARLAIAAQRWYERSGRCTPPGAEPPRRRARRIAVLVGGLGSSGPDGASVFQFDTAGAGYAPADVFRFSYTGGDARLNPYTPRDTQQPVVLSALRLRETILDLAKRYPGVPIDVIAHSQGGLVSRAALATSLGPALPVSTLVTLATPHDGASLATAGTLFRATSLGEAVLDAAGEVGGIDPQSASVRDLSEGSDFVSWLRRQTIPAGIRFVSVAARNDVVVPSPDCYVAGADNITVTVGPPQEMLSDHDALPKSPAATREVALAINGLPPTCEPLVDALTDALVGDGIEVGEDTVAAALGTVP